VTLRVTAAAMRTIDKLGLDNFARKQGVKLK
jgi:ribosomal protein L28